MSDQKGTKITPGNDKSHVKSATHLPTSNEAADKTLENLHLSKVLDEEKGVNTFENTAEIDTKADLPGKGINLLNPSGESRVSINSNTDLQSKPLINPKGTNAKVKSEQDNVALAKTIMKSGVTLFSYDPASLQKHEARVRKAPISYRNIYKIFFTIVTLLFIILISVFSAQKVGSLKQKITANFLINEYPLQVNKTTMPFNSFTVFSEENLQSKLAELMWDEQKRLYGTAGRRRLDACNPALASIQIQNPDGTCTQCDAGFEANAARIKCVRKCAAGETLSVDGQVCNKACGPTDINKADGSCFPCIGGQVPNQAKNKCVPNCDADQTLSADETVCLSNCKDNEINKPDGSCFPCIGVQVPNAAKTECVIPKETCQDEINWINKPSDGKCSLCIAPKKANAARDECVIIKDACQPNQINIADGSCQTCEDGKVADASFQNCIKDCPDGQVPSADQTECITESGGNFNSGNSGGSSSNQALLSQEVITTTLTFTAGYEFQYMFSPPESIVNTIATDLELTDPANTIKFISGKPKDATNYEVVYTLTGVDKTTAALLESKQKDYYNQDKADLKAPINSVVIVNHFDETTNLIENGVAKVTDPQTNLFTITPLKKGENYQTLVDQIKIKVKTEVTLQPEEYFKWIFTNQPTDIVQKIKADAGFKTDFLDYWKLTDITSTELKVGQSYTISYTFIDYNVDVAASHIKVNTEFYAKDIARLYAPIKTVKVTKTDVNGAQVSNIVENGVTKVDGYDQITLSSGLGYEAKLEEIAIKVTTKIVMTIGEVGGENYQYLIDLPNILTTIANQMGLSDKKAIYLIGQEAKSQTFELTYGIKAYSSELIAQYETLNKDYFVNNKAQLEAPITSVYVTKDSGSPYYLVENGQLNSVFGSTTLTSGSGMVAKLESLATSFTTKVTFKAPQEFKYSQSPSDISSITSKIATQMGIDQSSITFESSSVGVSGAEYHINYKITEYNSVSLASAESKQTSYFTEDRADLTAPIKTVFVTYPGKSAYFIIIDGVVKLSGYQERTLTKGSSYNSTLESQAIRYTTSILFDAGYEYEHFYGATDNDFTDKIAQQQNILPWNRVRLVSFGSSSESEFKVVYTTAAYNSEPSKAYEEEQIKYFATDKAQLFAPIKQVEVTSPDGTTYKIIEDNKIVYSGYTGNSLTSGQDYQQQVQALGEVISTTTLILKAGDEYETFVPDAASFVDMLSSQMGVRASGIRRTYAKVLNDRVGEEEYKIVYQIVEYHSKSAKIKEELQVNYYIDNKARLIAPIKSVEVQSYDGSSYFIIQDSKILDSYQKTTALSSGAQWQEKIQENFFKTVAGGYKTTKLDDVPSNAIRTTVKMDGNYNLFRNSDGQVTFINNLARSLNVNYSQITIKNHYAGSIVIIYDLTPKDGQTREELKAQQSDAYARGQIDLGSPIQDVESIDADNNEPAIIIEDGKAADIINGQTKNEYIRSLKVEDFQKYLCDKAKISLNFKDLDQNAQSTYFTGCQVVNEPSQPFNKLILHHQMTDTDTLKYKNKRFLTAEQSIAYNYNAELNGLRLESQQLSLIYEDTKTEAKYPDLLFEQESTNTLFTTKGEQVIGSKTIPNNLHVQYWSDVNVTEEGRGKNQRGAKNDTNLVFEKYGLIQPVEGVWTPEFFFNFDYHQRVTSFQYFTFADAVFDTIIALPLTVGVILSIFAIINIIMFYRQLAQLIQRRYSDALQFQKIKKYLSKFEKIHAALEDIEQFKPIIEEIKTFMDENYDQKTYEQIDLIVKKMADLDNMLPNLDDLEQSIGARVDPKKVTPADEILSQRANMDIFEIIDLVKDRVSIFGIFKLHDEVHIQNSKLGAEIKLANSKLEYLYRQLDKKRNSSKKKSDATPTNRTKSSVGAKEKAN